MYRLKDGKYVKSKPAAKTEQSATARLDAKIAELMAAANEKDAKIAELTTALEEMKKKG